ncbi:DUF1987 domain-containing protein [Aquaspirillum soli]|jgi:hypothetical protein
MQSIRIPAAERTPEVEFDFASGRLSLAGESYPEDTAAFFGPLQQALHDYLTTAPAATIEFDLRMVYFNSSSAKALMNLFRLLEEQATRGLAITIRWWYHEEDETMLESGEDFAEEFQHAQFLLTLIT